jgi:bacterioferritin (cytochrome b1)
VRPRGHDKLIAALNSDIGREYTTVLQYLFQSFVHKRNRLGKELQIDLAQWHMKHWGWMAERVSSLGGEVNLQHDDIDRTRDAGYVLRTDIRRQRELADHYAEERQELEDEETRFILARIEAHDRYQAEQLEAMLDEMEEPGDEDTYSAERQGEPVPPSPAAPPPPRFTVGSLFGRKQDE